MSLAVLTYHAIGTGGAVTATEPGHFASTLRALTRAGWRAIALDEWVANGRPDVAKGYAVTFDDGLRSILGVVDDLLAWRVPATVFLVTDRIGRDNGWAGQPGGIPVEPLLSASEVRELARLGVRFGSHAASHARLDRMEADEVERELRASREVVEDLAGGRCPLLAYPYGVSSRGVRGAAARWYEAAFGTRLDLARGGHDAFNLPRLDAYYLRDPRRLDDLIAGRAGPWLRWRRSLRAARRLAVGGPGR